MANGASISPATFNLKGSKLAFGESTSIIYCPLGSGVADKNWPSLLVLSARTGTLFSSSTVTIAPTIGPPVLSTISPDKTFGLLVKGTIWARLNISAGLALVLSGERDTAKRESDSAIFWSEFLCGSGSARCTWVLGC